MSLRTDINGVFNAQDINRLAGRQVAWNGTVPQEERARQEAEVGALVDEAREALNEHPDIVAVRIQDGEIVESILVSSEDEDSSNESGDTFDVHVDFQGYRITASVDGDRVSLSQDGHHAGDGKLTADGRIEGCAARLGARDGSQTEDAYELIEDAIADAMADRR